MNPNKAVFLDRDGVLNTAIIRDGKPFPPAILAELEVVVDAEMILTQLKSAGYLLIVVTNQPDVARGKTSAELVLEIHNQLRQQLPIDEFYTCFHDDHDDCKCRKPLPGMLIQAAKDFNICLEQSIMIGDRWKDIEAGQRAGCKTIWLNHGYQEQKPQEPCFTVNSLTEAYSWIIRTDRSRENGTQ